MSDARGESRRMRAGLQSVKRRMLALLDVQIRQRCAPVRYEASQAPPPPVDGRGFAHEGEA